jgi:hypothetical protein
LLTEPKDEEKSMDELKELARLLERLGEKLEYTRRLIAEYEETMDYASHCNLLGFAEGIEFALEEIGETLKGKRKAQGKPGSKSRKRGAG